MIIALTGGICSGKSTAAKFFEELDVPVIYCDKVAKRVYQNPYIIEKIKEMFGNDVISNGILNENKIRNIVFYDQNKLILLQKLLDPYIYELVLIDITYFKSVICPKYLIIEIPRECDFKKICVNRVLYIGSEKEDRIKRAMKRDDISEEMVKKIIEIQEKNDVIVLDYIYNDKSVDDLKNEVLKHHNKYLKLSAGDL